VLFGAREGSDVESVKTFEGHPRSVIHAELSHEVTVEAPRS
jgi:hypothetical protein